MNCKEDDEGDVYVGVWIGTVAETDCPSDEDDFSNELACDENTCYRLTIVGDGSFTYQQGLATLTGTWSVSGSSLSLCTLEDGEQECVLYATTLGAKLTLSLLTESTGCTTTTTFDRE